MVHQNSLYAYQTHIKPTLKKRHVLVMDALAILGEATSLDVADYLRKPLNAVSGRFSELSGNSKGHYESPVIEEVGRKNNRYGNPCSIYRIIEKEEVCGI
jgi:hypothetical protein